MNNNNTNIGIDFSALLNTKINEAFLKSSKDSKPMQIILKFANDHGYFGTDALVYIMDLLNMLEEASKAIKEEQNK